jgi:hypothetical protein
MGSQAAASLLDLKQEADTTVVNYRCDGPTSRLCEELIPDFVKGVEDRVKSHLDSAYAGKHQKIAVFDLKEDPHEAGMTFQTPSCNLSKGESKTNRLGQSCGAKHCEFHKPNGAVCPICYKPKCPFSKLLATKAARLTQTGGCQYERAWKRGALMQEVLVAQKHVLDQVKRDRFLIIGPGCNSGLKDPEFGKICRTLNGLVAQWTEANDGKSKISCDVSPVGKLEEETPEVLDEEDRRVPKQRACYLNAALTQIQMSVAEAAVCEIFDRAEARWLSNTRPRVDNVVPNTFETAMNTCKDRQDYADCVRREYEAAIEGNFRAVMPEDATYGDKPHPGAPSEDARPLKQPSAGVAGIGALFKCPSNEPDCKTCQNPLTCGAPTHFSNAQLSALWATASFLDAARKNIKLTHPLRSASRAFDPVRGGMSLREPAAQRAPVPVSSPEPSPSPSGLPEPDRP